MMISRITESQAKIIEESQCTQEFLRFSPLRSEEAFLLARTVGQRPVPTDVSSFLAAKCVNGRWHRFAIVPDRRTKRAE